MKPGSDATPETITKHIRALAVALTARGLSAEPFGTRMVMAKNSAADPSAQQDTRGARMSPGLKQTVLCQWDDSGHLAWYWMWAGATREAPPELEYLGPAEDIERTAERLARVLRLDGRDAEPVP
ncbi:hypothetical protein AB0L00_04990 [Actinoallomurus sp. NPDC052308]|uniref:hypothetical protein n=1 Tax=Actinoallomurus sp. NPDC052308 TaxID=3155530 RepID=UPI003446C8BA